MRDTRSGERTAVEAVRSGFAEAAALTSGEETTTGSPGCEGTTDDVPPEVILETGVEETSLKERAAAKLLLVCLAVIMVRKAYTMKKWNN